MSKKHNILLLLVLPINIFYYFETKYLNYINNKNKEKLKANRNDRCKKYKQFLNHHPIQYNYIKDYPNENHNP